MKRRKIIKQATLALLAGFSTTFAEKSLSQTKSPVAIKWLGHSSFLFSGDGITILVNPFKDVGCNANYRSPKVEANLVLISSKLLDEGFTEGLPGNPKIISEPGDYEVKGIKIRGISLAHDREKGRRFGMNVAWIWSMGGIRILHLGGAAGAIDLEQKILIGSPDVILIPVGGGPKAYDGAEALQVMKFLNPRIAIPTQYLTKAADPGACESVGLQNWLDLVKDQQITNLDTNEIVLTQANIPKEGTKIVVFSDSGLLKA